MIVAKDAPAVHSDPILCDFDLPLQAVFHPLGFPVEVATNSHDVLLAAKDSWGLSQLVFPEVPVQISFGVTQDEAQDCPPAPVCRGRRNLISLVSDEQNFGVCDLRSGFAFSWVTEATVRNRAYFRYHFLESMALIMLMSRYLTPIHAACVAFNGRGILLCGESRAGKSSLAFACARKGWTFIADDASSLVRNRSNRVVVGNPHQMRFRESAIEIFPDLGYERVAPRVNGEMAIELATSDLPEIVTAPQAPVDYIVFLNRRNSGPATLTGFSREQAARWFEQVVCYGDEEDRDAQKASLRNLLTAEIFELAYSNLDAAVNRLESMTRKGF